MAFRVTGDFIADHNREGQAVRASGYRRHEDAERPARMRTGVGGIV